MFGSEAKALFASGEVRAAADLAGLDQVFTLWAPQAPRTAFAGVRQLEPGGVLVWERGEIVEQRRWWPPGPDQPDPGDGDLEDTLRDSIRLRLRADVPVGAYLSGGLDSSLISALAQVQKQGELRTFSVAFDDPSYDERAEQELVARAIGTSHHVVDVGATEIAAAFPEVVRHAETPLVRTAPVPLYLLAREVNEHDLKVVVTGEGADELFWGYDLFKEVAIRRLHGTDPERALELLADLYPHLGSTGARRGPGWARFLLETGAGDDPLASHLTRVAATGAVRGFYRDEVAAELNAEAALEPVREGLPAGFAKLGRARARRLAGGDHPARALPAGGAGRSGCDGARGGGALPVSRSSRLRPLGRAAGRGEAHRGERQGRPAQARRRAAAGRDSQAPEAALPGSRGDAVLLARLSGLGRGGAFAGGARRERHLGRPPGRGPAAALPRRPGDRRARGDGPDRDPVDPALA